MVSLHLDNLGQYLCFEVHNLNYNVKSPLLCTITYFTGFPGSSDGKEFACNAEHAGSIPGLGRYPGGGNGNPLQYSCLENSMGKGAWQAPVHVARSETRLSS